MEDGLTDGRIVGEKVSLERENRNEVKIYQVFLEILNWINLNCAI